jgi:elongation factor G
MRNLLRLPAAAVQYPIGLEGEHEGVIDLITKKAFHFLGDKGTKVTEVPIPESLEGAVEEKRKELIERLADVDDDIAEKFLMEEELMEDELKAAIRKQTLAKKFVPVFMGSAYKNRGVQKLLDGVISYLPNPSEVQNVALDLSNKEAEVPISCDGNLPLVALAFKLEDGKFGQLTYLRIYQGTLRKGDTVINMKVRTHMKLSHTLLVALSLVLFALSPV